MNRKLRGQRVWALLEQFPRAVLYRTARAAQTPVRHATKKHELLEMLSALPEATLEQALIEGLTGRDLQDLCARIGRSRKGTKGDLAARIVAAIDQPAARSRWRPFAEARAFARGLALRSSTEWYALARGHLPAKGTLPADIPRKPEVAYAQSGWTTWGDFLGTGNLAPSQRTFRSFSEARAFARRLALKSCEEWRTFVRGHLPAKGTLPSDIPRAPDAAYAQSGWTTWGDFLGTGNQATQLQTYRPFRQARTYARSLDLRNRKEWCAFLRTRSGNQRRLPPDIPATPHIIYAKEGWAGYPDWLGIEDPRDARGIQYRSYEDACAFVRALGIRTESEWKRYCRGQLDGHDPRPRDIPAAPNQVYRGRGWVSWGQFLGTNSVATSKRTFRPFTAARAYAHTLGLQSRPAWNAWCAAGHRPADIPAVPNRVYHGRGWVSWSDFLGASHVSLRRIRDCDFQAARAFVRRLGLRSGGEYRRAWRAGHIPKDIPARIEQHPAWKGWADFLGPSYTGSPERKPKTPKRGR